MEVHAIPAVPAVRQVPGYVLALVGRQLPAEVEVHLPHDFVAVNP